MSASSHISDHALSDASLLREFVQSGSRAAFTEMVARYSGLVFAAAQRITGDRSMAEEAVQNVFAILAKKASDVAGLPHPGGWLHQTAAFEARKRLRSETRHRRKLAAFAENMSVPASPEPDHPWADILPYVDECIQRLRPAEQRAIRMRYLEDRSYADIAAALGKSDEAGKKQTRRAMERLCQLLRRRGVVSAAALGSALSAGARTATASAMPAGPLASAALAAAPSLSRAALLIHALHTMNHARTVLSAAALLALLATPVLWQEAVIARTRDQLAKAEANRAGLAEETAVNLAAGRLPPPEDSNVAGTPSAEEPLTIEIVADIAEKMKASLDRSSETNRRLAQLQQADASELLSLLAAGVKLSDVKRRERTQLFLLSQLGSKDPAAAVKEAAALCPQLSEVGWEPPEGIESVLMGIYREWLRTNFRAALTSFETLRDAGAFHGRGIHQTGGSVADAVTGACYAYSREDALRLYRKLDPTYRVNAITTIARSAAPEDREFVIAEAMQGEERHRTYILSALLSGEAQRHGPDAAAALLKQLDLPCELRTATVAQMLETVAIAPALQGVTQALQWAKQNLSPEECAEAGGRWLAQTGHLPPGNAVKSRMAAFRDFDWGSARDRAIAAFLTADERVKEPGEAASLAVEINDHALKVGVLRKIASSPLRPSGAVANIVNSDPTLSTEDRSNILKR